MTTSLFWVLHMYTFFHGFNGMYTRFCPWFHRLQLLSYWNQMEHVQSLRTEVSYTGSQVSCLKNTVSYGAHALYTRWTLHILNFWNLSHQMCMRKSNFELYLIWTMDLKTSVTHRCVLWFQSDCICNKTYHFPFCELQRTMFHWWMKSC